jgi:hypothetical protein
MNHYIRYNLTFTDDCFKNYKMDALKLFGKRFLVNVLSQLESYSVRYNQFDNTTFRLGWFLGVLDRFSPTKPEDEIAIDRLIAQLQQVRDCLFGVGGLCVVGRAS